MKSYRRYLKCFVQAFALNLLLVASAFAAIDSYKFADEQLRQRFHSLTYELRCPKCQNQNLADSNSPIAEDLRAQVYRLLNEGQSDAGIKDYMVARYGQYVLYKPQWSSRTWMLWLAPALLLLIAFAGAGIILGKRKNRGPLSDGGSLLTEQEQQRVQELLGQKKDD